MAEDRIYAIPFSRVGDFEFDDKVADVFPDMIRRSVPGYASILAMTAEIAQRYATTGSCIYDLGCSLGAASLAIRERIPPSCQIQAIDASPAMVRRLRAQLEPQPADLARMEVHEGDLRTVPIQSASVVVLNFTLQFIPSRDREACLQRIFHGLNPGGVLILSEKICFDDAAEQAWMTELHHAFKRAHGYSALEIAQKRTALENTLVTETAAAHLDRLRRVGFALVTRWYQCLNFISVVAVK